MSNLWQFINYYKAAMKYNEINVITIELSPNLKLFVSVEQFVRKFAKLTFLQSFV